jgi:hypothetical protein
VSTLSSAASIAAAQAPRCGELNLDHIAYFVPNIDQSAAALEKLGFTLTPFSAQSHPLEPGGPARPAGTGNRCMMFTRGYVECLTPTADTQAANQLRAAIKRYVGLHLIAFGTAAPALDHARLTQHGFAPIAPIALERPLDTPGGEDIARFTVVRVPPQTMAEGRIQFCQHHTPRLVWQPQWLTHANRASALTAVIVCVESPAQAAQRYARFTGLKAAGAGDSWCLDTARGRLLFSTPAVIKRVFNVDAPALPWIAGYVLASSDMNATREHIAGTGCAHGELNQRRSYVLPPPSVGGFIVFEPEAGTPLEFGLHAV